MFGRFGNGVHYTLDDNCPDDVIASYAVHKLLQEWNSNTFDSNQQHSYEEVILKNSNKYNSDQQQSNIEVIL